MAPKSRSQRNMRSPKRKAPKKSVLAAGKARKRAAKRTVKPAGPGMVETALAADNAGLRHADVWAKEGGDIRAAIRFPETKQYVLRVMRGRDRYQSLYPASFK